MIEVHDRVVIQSGDVFSGMSGVVTIEGSDDGVPMFFVETDEAVIVGRHNYRDGWFYGADLVLEGDDE